MRGELLAAAFPANEQWRVTFAEVELEGQAGGGGEAWQYYRYCVHAAQANTR